MKPKDIITRVRNMAGDTSALQFTDAMLVDWINDGIRQCVIDNSLLQTRGQIAVTAGQDKYAVPSNMLRLHSLKYDESSIPVRTLQEYEQISDMSSDTGTVKGAYIWAGYFNLYPVPDTSGKILTVDFLRAPDEISEDSLDASILPIPTEYHSRLVDYCLAQVAQQDGDTNLYAIKMQEFTTGVQNLKHQSEINDDQYPHMGVSNRDMGDMAYEGWGW